MDLEVSGADISTLEDGTYTVKVSDLQARETDYGIYLDFMLDVQEHEYEGLKFGVPFNNEITSSSMLGQLIEDVTGEPVAAGESYDLEEIFMGQELEVQTKQDSDGFPSVIKTIDDELAIKAVE